MNKDINNKLAARLNEALKNSGMTKSQLAKEVQKTPAAVTGWLAGKKKPTRANLKAIARALSTDVTWLETGTGAAPVGDLQKLRDDYQKLCSWAFRPAPEDGGRDYGNANVWAFDPTLAVMTNDILQNCSDARKPGEQTVEVTFRIIRLKGKDLQDFQDAIGWETLLPHLQASSQIDQRLGRLLHHNLQQLESDKEMLLLAVEDKGTIGLIGEETGEGNFAALVRNNLDSDKQETTSGGCFGLGKAVLWRMSAFSTVLFGSNLFKPTNEGMSRFRMMGRCDLTWHQLTQGQKVQKKYAGPGWYGQQEDGLSVSCWNNPALLNDLHLGREDTPGTTALIVGFNDPSSPEPRTPADLAKDIRAAVADSFWPELALGKMKVNVEVWEGHKRKSGGEVVADEYREEFVDAITKWQNDEIAEKFSKSGDVVCVPVTLHYPERRADPKHPAGEHEATLLVRYAGETAGNNSNNSRLYELAMFRGVGMVVKYLSLKHVRIGALPFHAALLCGNAAVKPGEEPTSECREADQFLRTSEPPSHNNWGSTPDLSAEYRRPTKTAIDRFIDAVKKAIGDIVRPSTEELDDGPNSIKELLKIGEEPEDSPERPRIHRAEAELLEDGSWKITSRIHVIPKPYRWRMKPVILFDAESGPKAAVRWRCLTETRNCQIDQDGYLVMDAETREAVFTGESDPNSHPVDSRESCVVLDLYKCTKLKEVK